MELLNLQLRTEENLCRKRTEAFQGGRQKASSVRSLNPVYAIDGH